MKKGCSGIGNNPWVLNVITVSAHGLTFDGDAIAVITELEEDGTVKPRFINISGMARNIAQCKYTINIFILSMCRVNLDDEKLQYAHRTRKDEWDDYFESSPSLKIYDNLRPDTSGKVNKCTGYHQPGYSVLLFGAQEGKVVLDGDVSKWFFAMYNDAKDRTDNIGWEIILRSVPGNRKRIESSAKNEALDEFYGVQVFTKIQAEERRREEEKEEEKLPP